MFREEKRGNLKIFERPRPEKSYSLGADVAEGLATGDSSTAFIIDTEMNHVASYCGKIHPDLFGEMLCRLGDWYNSALLTVEINNHGILTLDRIKRRNYPNVFTRTVEEIRGEEIQKRIGWQTTAKTKMKMLDEFVAQYRDGELKINDVDLLKEMAGLVVEDGGDVVLNGKDRIVAACLAIQGLPQVVRSGEFKAFTPSQKRQKDLLNLSTEERAKRLSVNKEYNSFE